MHFLTSSSASSPGQVLHDVSISQNYWLAPYSAPLAGIEYFNYCNLEQNSIGHVCIAADLKYLFFHIGCPKKQMKNIFFLVQLGPRSKSKS